jgi:hypothetical protein
MHLFKDVNYKPDSIKILCCYLLILYRLEFVLAYAAFRTLPIVRNIFKRCSGRDAAGIISDDRVINIAANQTYILLHCISPDIKF